VAGVDQAAIGQREDLAAHRAVQRPRVALLEIGAPQPRMKSASPVKAIRAVVEHVGGAAAGVAGRGARLEWRLPSGNSLGGLQIQIGAFRAARRRDRDAAAELCLRSQRR